MNGWRIAAAVAGGVFTVRVLFFSGVLVPRWRAMERKAFLDSFARTINTADKVQPALLVAAIGALVMVATSTQGTESALAIAASTGFAVIMLASVAVMVPLQRRMIREGYDPKFPLAEMKTRWIKGHFGRTFLSTISFVLMVLTVSGVG